MGGKKEQSYRTLSPGPGAYEPSSKITKDDVISFKIGSSSRVNIIPKEAASLPGPGMYTEQKPFG